MDSFTRFNETKLPEKEKYYSILRNEGITDEEYNFAKEMWTRFKLKNLGQLHDIYMNTDVFENFSSQLHDIYMNTDVFESFIGKI